MTEQMNYVLGVNADMEIVGCNVDDIIPYMCSWRRLVSPYLNEVFYGAFSSSDR